MRELLDRRGALALGLGAGVGLLLPPGAHATSLPTDERRLLAVLLETELLTAATVQRVLASPHLHPRAQAVARQVLAAEHAHAAALVRALRRLGSEARPGVPGSAAGLDQALALRHVHQTISGLHNEHDCLDLLLALESMAEGVLYAAMPHLRDAALQRLAAGLLASEAQHEAVLGLLRNPKDFDRAAPYAFVEGFSP